MILRPVTWLVLVALVVSSCSTTMNLRREDYARIDPVETYTVLMSDGREFRATNLVVGDDTATFIADGKPVSVPVAEIQTIQQVTEHALLSTASAVGIGVIIVGGLYFLLRD